MDDSRGEAPVDERRPFWDVAVELALGAGRLTFLLRSASPGVALVGPSGAGKSTCLRILAGLESGAQGQITVGGTRWQDPQHVVPPWRRRVGWVPQDGGLLPHATVRENLAWGGGDADNLAAIASRLEIDRLLGRRPRGLSGGERQRVALGRALLSRPSVLLLDEPFSALDRPLRERVAATVAEIVHARALPFVLVCHDEPATASFPVETWTIDQGVTRRGRAT